MRHRHWVMTLCEPCAAHEMSPLARISRAAILRHLTTTGRCPDSKKTQSRTDLIRVRDVATGSNLSTREPSQGLAFANAHHERGRSIAANRHRRTVAQRCFPRFEGSAGEERTWSTRCEWCQRLLDRRLVAAKRWSQSARGMWRTSTSRCGDVSTAKGHDSTIVRTDGQTFWVGAMARAIRKEELR